MKDSYTMSLELGSSIPCDDPKRTAFAFVAFDKIQNVVNSCATPDQFENAKRWAMEVFYSTVAPHVPVKQSYGLLWILSSRITMMEKVVHEFTEKTPRVDSCEPLATSTITGEDWVDFKSSPPTKYGEYMVKLCGYTGVVMRGLWIFNESSNAWGWELPETGAIYKVTHWRYK